MVIDIETSSIFLGIFFEYLVTREFFQLDSVAYFDGYVDMIPYKRGHASSIFSNFSLNILKHDDYFN